jgi:hypothetical protein
MRPLLFRLVIVLTCLTSVFCAAACNDGIRLNRDLSMRKRLPGTPLAFVRSEVDLPTELVWETGPRTDDVRLFPDTAPAPWFHGTVAWDDSFAVGTRYRMAPPPDGRSHVSWYVIDLRSAVLPRLAFDGEDRAAYEAARTTLGVRADLVPRPILWHWPNWEGSPRPWGRDDRAPELDPATGVASTVRALPVGTGYFVQDCLRTFLWLSRDPPNPARSRTPVEFARRTSDVFRIGWDERFIVADVCFLVGDGASEPTVDRTMPVGSVVIDTKTGRCSPEMNRRSIAKSRSDFGVPDTLTLRDVVDVWPDWPEIRRPWRRDPATMKYLGLE